MRAKVVKKLRREIKEHSGLLPWQSYEGMSSEWSRDGRYRVSGKQQIVLAECQKALYHELKKEYYKEKNQ